MPLYQISDEMLLVGFPNGFNEIVMASNEYCSVGYCAFHCTTCTSFKGFMVNIYYSGLIRYMIRHVKIQLNDVITVSVGIGYL